VAGLFPHRANVPTPEQLAKLEGDNQLVDELSSLPDLAPNLPTTGKPESTKETSKCKPAHDTPEQPDKRKKDMTSTATTAKTSMTGTTTGSGSPPLNSRLTGMLPNVFTRDQAMATKFLRQFEMYQTINKDVSIMQEPTKRVITFLSYIRGLLVDDWVAMMVK
jgi:hypothetical protein